MTRGHQTDPDLESELLDGFAETLDAWHLAEERARCMARVIIDDGARAEQVAATMGVSRATLYRWLRS